ncbi:TfoX/Sxy family protein [Ruminococcaceae bacterium OttesenSCG-928-O06]|nr:TfoX/Sxy family protein [Ruminococcaceae bacterium OttesenSCG-928-O06]
MGELVKLPNIAEKMEQQLAGVGITTTAQLRDVGSREAWLRIQAQDASACYNRLCGLEGAIQGVRWHHLPEETKAELKVFYQAHKLPRPAGKPGKNAPTEKEETGAG